MVLLLLLLADPDVVSRSARDKAASLLEAEVASSRGGAIIHRVWHDGAIVHEAAAGGLTPSSIVRIYSMTKPVTSVAAMMLHEQGRFALDDPVADYLPKFADVQVYDARRRTLVPPKRPLTVRDVMRHTTGYAYAAVETPAVNMHYVRWKLLYDPLRMTPPDLRLDAFADRLAAVPLLHQPGQRFTYGYSTDLLGRLIEVWSGQTLDRYFSDAIFTPLGMTDTAFDVPEAKRDRVADLYTTKGGRAVVALAGSESPFNEGFRFLSGGGGLSSTLDDYTKFAAMLARRGRVGDRQLVQPETLRLTQTNQLPRGRFRFGLGFKIEPLTLRRGGRRIATEQYGWSGAASTRFEVVPDAGLVQIALRQHMPQDLAVIDRMFEAINEGIDPRVVVKSE